MRVFRIFGLPHFPVCFLTICGTVVEENEKTQEGSKLGFWEPLADFEVEGGRNFGSGYVSQNSRVSPRVVSLCGAVGVHGECHRVGHVVVVFSIRLHF